MKLNIFIIALGQVIALVSFAISTIVYGYSEQMLNRLPSVCLYYLLATIFCIFALSVVGRVFK